MQHIFPNESTECIQSEIRNESTECIQSEIQNESTERIESEIWNKNTEFNQNNIMGEKSDIETDISNIHSTNPIEFVDCGLSSSDQMEVELNVRRSERLKDKPQMSYKFFESCVLNAHSFFNSVPNSFNDIENRNDTTKWKEAIKEELDSHTFNETWCLVDRPDNKNIVDCKWVFTIKHDENGNPVKYKARLVVRGFTQQFMIDYDETFTPVARISNFRLI